nr:hypothetical protein CFP56_58182 [Quercus suber]
MSNAPKSTVWLVGIAASPGLSVPVRDRDSMSGTLQASRHSDEGYRQICTLKWRVVAMRKCKPVGEMEWTEVVDIRTRADAWMHSTTP